MDALNIFSYQEDCTTANTVIGFNLKRLFCLPAIIWLQNIDCDLVWLSGALPLVLQNGKKTDKIRMYIAHWVDIEFATRKMQLSKHLIGVCKCPRLCQVLFSPILSRTGLYAFGFCDKTKISTHIRIHTACMWTCCYETGSSCWAEFCLFFFKRDKIVHGVRRRDIEPNVISECKRWLCVCAINPSKITIAGIVVGQCECGHKKYFSSFANLCQRVIYWFKR